MLQNNIQMTYFISQLKTLINSMVVKRDKAAIVLEPDLDSTKAADRYITAIEFGDNWDTYVTFDSDVLLAAGLDRNMISFFLQDKNNIPRAVRNKVVTLQKEKIISSYIERNEYYRMLAGLPPLNDTESDFIYAPANDFGIPTTTPIHQLSYENISFLRSSGLLDELIKKYPNKNYIKFLGDRSISIYTARTANNFDILYIDKTLIDTAIYRDFRTFYDKSRACLMIGYYNKEYANMFVWYDEFIGLLILVMAIQRIISNIYKQGLTRDFYDAELIQYLFKSYSIPYIEQLDLNYQKIIAKNLNKMLQYKSTDKVLYDVAYLLGFYNINIYKYYLIKTHKLDENYNPVFIYETDGSLVYDKMYNFHFQKVNLQEKDLNVALTDTKNRVDFDTLVMEDPYWINDTELMNKLYTTNFNNIITKYMSLDVAYKIVEMMYEITTVLRMILDNRRDFQYITFEIPSIMSKAIPLYDIVIFLCALGAKKMDLKGSVPIKGYQIPSVYGFNYKANLEKLREEIYNNEGEYTKIDPSLVNFILNMRASSVSDVDRLFTNITSLRKIITEYLFTVKDKETYYQYRKLYRSLLLVNDIEETYKDHNGDIQTTYESLLMRINPDLYTVYLSAKDDKVLIDQYIDNIFIRMATISNEFRYMASVNRGDIIFDSLLKLIRFFKSYTVDFVNSGIHYFLDDRHLMGLKLMEIWYFGNVSIEPRDYLTNLLPWYKDFIDEIEASIQFKENSKLYDFLNMSTNSSIYDKLFILKDRMRIESEIMFREKFGLVGEVSVNVDYNFTNRNEKLLIGKDSMFKEPTDIEIRDKSKLIKMDKMLSVNKEMALRESMEMIDYIQTDSENQFRSNLNLKDRLFIHRIEG